MKKTQALNTKASKFYRVSYATQKGESLNSVFIFAKYEDFDKITGPAVIISSSKNFRVCSSVTVFKNEPFTSLTEISREIYMDARGEALKLTLPL